MKHLLLFPLLFWAIIGHAQFAPFPTTGLEYGSIYVCNPFDCASYFNNSMRYAGDSLLCGNTWSRFELLPNANNSVFLRADQGKYYHLQNCSDQVLLYDFSKGLGDTVLTGDLGPLQVIDVGIFTFNNGVQRKKMVMQSLPPSFPQQYTWVDGIGDIERGFFRPSDFEGGYGQLICVVDSSGFFYYDPPLSYLLNCDSLRCPLPHPGFDYSCTDMTFYFNNLSTESDSYLWDFGDGESSTETNPVHTFVNPGCYTVVLKARSECLPQDYISVKKVAANAPFFWKKSANSIPEGFPYMQFLDPQHGWAIGDQKIWKTLDGGIHWDTVPYPGPIRPMGGLHFKDFEHGIVQISKPGPPYYYSDILWTDDGGAHWGTQVLGNNPTISAIERVNDSVAVVSAHFDNLYLTRNRGQNWQFIQVPWSASLISDFESVGGDTVYFIGIDQVPYPNSTTVFGKTTDLIHWSVQEFPGVNYGEQLRFTSPQEGWMSNKTSVYHTTDGGQTWVQQLVAYVSEIDFADALHGWACGYSGIYGTKDGGQSWEEQACIRAGEFIRGLNAFSPDEAYVLLNDGLYTYTEMPDTVSLCASSPTQEPAFSPKSAFFVHPNPASNEIAIEWNAPVLPETVFTIYNAQGIVVFQQPAVTTQKVALSHLPVGLYFLQAHTTGKKQATMVEKLLIVR